MRTLTIPQPRASGIFQSGWTVELRSWSTEYRGPVAIHAKRTAQHLTRAEIDRGDYERRAIVGLATIVDCVNLVELESRRARRGGGEQRLAGGMIVDDLLREIYRVEEIRGGWSSGRRAEWAIVLDYCRPFSRAVPFAETVGLGDWPIDPRWLESYDEWVRTTRVKRAQERSWLLTPEDAA